MSYFISGLPRSRTAWLSVFMSQSGAYCHHDGFNNCLSMDEYRQKIKNCGDSSTGLTIIDINKEFPESKVVIIEKSDQEFDKCVEWCNAMYGGDSQEALSEMREKQAKIKGLKVSQSDINDQLKDIWRHLVNAPWDDKYLKLTQFNIQSNPFSINLNAAKALYASIQ